MGGGWVMENLIPRHPVVFPKMYLIERGEGLFFVTFNIIISHNFPKNLIEIRQVVQKI